jgi:type IV secretion system protein VirB9
MRKTFLLLLAFSSPAALWAGDTSNTHLVATVAQESRTVVIHEKDIVHVAAQLRETTLIVLPREEKVMEVFCGDKDNWIINGAENFITVKPAVKGARTDVHIITDHANAYTLSFSEVSDMPGAVSDLKVFLQPAADGGGIRLKSSPVFISAEVAERYKQEAAEAAAKVDAEVAEAQRKAKAESDQFRASYPAKLQFDYTFERGKNPFNVSAIYRDDKFTYIRATPQEVPALYELKDGKPSLINYQFANGLYTVPKILDAGYLVIGKQKLTFSRERGAN